MLNKIIIMIFVLLFFITSYFSSVYANEVLENNQSETSSLLSKNQPLSTVEIEQSLKELERWQYINNKLRREFQFSTFVEAFSFMTAMALVSESMGHHPEWSNIYNQVTIELTTHDANGVTLLDINWAKKADELAK